MRATFTRSRDASSRPASSTAMCTSNPRTCCRTITPRWWCRRARPRSSAIRTNSPTCSASPGYLLPDVVKAIDSPPVVPASLTVCTDDVFPDHLIEKGGVSDVLRRLIRYGLDPLQAIRCATINNAIRLRRDDLGMVAAGRRADLVMLSDLRDVAVETVYANGRRVAAQGRIVEAPRPGAAVLAGNTMKLPPLTLDDV